jgi:hypothetical protein
MDGIRRGPEVGGRGRQVAIRVRLVVLRTEFGRSGDDEDVMCRERELRRVTEAEHGEATVAGEEADGEHAAADATRLSSPSSEVDLVRRTVAERLVRSFPVEPRNEPEQIAFDRPERPVGLGRPRRASAGAPGARAGRSSATP